MNKINFSLRFKCYLDTSFSYLSGSLSDLHPLVKNSARCCSVTSQISDGCIYIKVCRKC